MKTIIQHDHISCGPVAISNAMRLLGIKPPSIKVLRKLCKTGRQGISGTWGNQMRAVLRTFGLKMTTVNQRRGNKIFIALYDNGEGGHHWAATYDGIIYNDYRGRYVRQSKIQRRFRSRWVYRIDKYK